MTAGTMTTKDFEATWQVSDIRFPYALNRGLLLLYGGLLAGFWSYWAVSVLNGGLDLVLGILGGIFACVSMFVIFNVMYWRHFARFSGTICTDDALLWRQGNNAWILQWSEIVWDDLGLTDFDQKTQKYEYFWRVGGKKLYLYRAHVRMRSMEVFMAVALKALKEAGRTPVSDSQGNSASGTTSTSMKKASVKAGRKKATRKQKSARNRAKGK